jgi:hypothetical protein
MLEAKMALAPQVMAPKSTVGVPWMLLWWLVVAHLSPRLQLRQLALMAAATAAAVALSNRCDDGEEGWHERTCQ